MGRRNTDHDEEPVCMRRLWARLVAFLPVPASWKTPAAWTLLRNLLLILTWYVLSTCLGLYNKKLVGKNGGVFGRGAFPAPLFMSGVQFAFQAIFAKAAFRMHVIERTVNKPIPWDDYMRNVLPNGVTTGLDVGFSNKSLVFITISFYTMCKATVPVFLLFFAFLFRIERPSWQLAGVVSVICTGLVLLVKGETDFDVTGFLLVMAAACLAGFRFTLTQISLHGHHDSAALGGPLEILELLTPIMAVTTLVLSVAWEHLWHVLPGSPYFETWGHTLATGGIIAVGAVIAFLMVWAEFKVIKETSALTFMIAGTVKEVVTVLAAVAVMGDHFAAVNAVGLAIVICGVMLFNVHKLQRMRAEGAESLAETLELKDRELRAGEREALLGGTSGASSSGNLLRGVPASGAGTSGLGGERDEERALLPAPGLHGVGSSDVALGPTRLAARGSHGGAGLGLGAHDRSIEMQAYEEHGPGERGALPAPVSLLKAALSGMGPRSGNGPG